MTAYSNPLKTSGDVAASSAFTFGLKGIISPFQIDKFLLKPQRSEAKYSLYDENQQPLFFIDRQVLKFKCDIGIYTDDTMNHKLLTLTQDSGMTSINQLFTLHDADGQLLAYFKRTGWASLLLRRTWKICDANHQEIAIAKEDVLWKAVLRRLLVENEGVQLLGALSNVSSALSGGVVISSTRGSGTKWFETNYNITRLDGSKLGVYNRRPMIEHVTDFTADSSRSLDRRIVVGICTLLDNVERTHY